MRGLPISRRQILQAMAQFVAATAGRNMTTAAYVAVTIGVAVMVLLTVAPAYEAAHHWVDGVLWACWAYFAVEWAVRLRHARQLQRSWAYALSGRGLVDAVGAIAIPLAIICGVEPKTAWLLAVLWVLKVVPGIPGLRQLRRVLVQESGPLVERAGDLPDGAVSGIGRGLFPGARRAAGRPSAACRPPCGGRSSP